MNGGGLQWATGNTTDISSRLAPLGAGGATFDTNGNAVRFATGLTGSGGLTKNGGGALFLLANNTYTGGTTVNGGILHIGAEGGPPGSIVGTVTVNGDDSHIAFLSTSSAGNLAITLNGGTGHFFGNSTGANATITANSASTWFIENSGSGGQARFVVNAGGAFDISPLAISGTTAGSIEGAGSIRLGSKQLSVGGNNLSTTVSGVIADGGRNGGTGGSLVKVGTGTLTLTRRQHLYRRHDGQCRHLVVNGSLGQHGHPEWRHAGRQRYDRRPCHQWRHAGARQLDRHADRQRQLHPERRHLSSSRPTPQGQSDRVNVAGTATINGGTVQVVAAPGNYGTSTTYTILNATGGVSGAYSGVSSNFAFLTPSLSYDANNVFLTLALQGNAFSGFGGNTVNQRAVGYALDQSFANATGDFATVIGALAGLSTQQGPAALDAISGQPYADFGTTNVANASLFMNTLGQQMALARSGSAPGARVALAAGVRGRGVRRCASAQRLVQRPGWAGLGAGRRQQLDAHLQCRRRRGRHRLSLRPALPGRCRRRLHPRHPVGELVHGPRLDRFGQRRGLRQLHPRVRAGSTPTLWSVTPTSTTRCSGRSRSRACSNARRRAARAPTSSWRRSRPATSSASGRWDRSRRSRASRPASRRRTPSPNWVRTR